MGVFLLPNSVLAACVADEATVVYINGIFTNLPTAQKDLNELADKYYKKTSDTGIKFVNGYNPSHLEGLGDLAQSGAQIMGKSVSNYDRDTILLQIHPQVTTRKLLLVGHSQGALYSNALYDYLLDHGEPREAVGVYQVASPASYVAGGGKYLTSSNDEVISKVRFLASEYPALKAKEPLPANIDLSASGNGHGFSGAYLAEAPDRIVGDIRSALKSLEPKEASDTGDCFTAPSTGLGYKATKAGFAVADTAAIGVRAGAGAAGRVAVAAGNALAFAAQSAYGMASKVAADIGVTVGGIAGISHAAEPARAQTNFDVFSRIYGSSISKEEYKDLVGDMGGAVATAPILAPASQPEPATLPAPEAVTRPASAPQANGLLSISDIIPLLSGSGGARHRHSSSEGPEPEVLELEAPDTAPVVNAVPATPDTATTTVPASTSTGEATPAPPTDTATSTLPIDETASTSSAPTLAFMLGGSPVTDSFDGYNGAGWETFGGYSPYGFSPGVIKYFATTTGCHSGGCISGRIELGNGGYGNPVRMYKTGMPVAEGSVAIWRKYHTGYVYKGNMYVMVCVGAPGPNGGKCDGIGDMFIGDSEDVWNVYYFAWRNNGTVKEFCTLRYDTDPLNCTWRPSPTITADEVPDTVYIAGDGFRPDLGDRLWFDDLGAP